MSDIRLLRPAAGTNQAVACEPEANFVFEFPTDAATLSRSGDDLVMTFEDGATLSLMDFYKTYSSDNMPSFDVGGSQVAGADFFTAMNEPDLMPAAGPGGNTAPGGGRYHEYANMALYDGLDRLGGLDVGWPDGGYEPELEGGAGDDAGLINATPSLDNFTTTPEDDGRNPNAAGTGSAGIMVDEASYAAAAKEAGQSNTGGAGSGDRGHGYKGRGGFDVHLNGEGGTVTLTDPEGNQVTFSVDREGNVTVLEGDGLTVNGVLVNDFSGTVDGEGTLHVEYKYELEGSRTHGNANGVGADDALRGQIGIHVVDGNGDTADGTLSVEVHDDGPVMSVGETSVTKATVTVDMGADSDGAYGGEDQATVEVFVKGDDEQFGADAVKWKHDDVQTSDLTEMGDGETWVSENGSMSVTKKSDGSYSFKLENEDADPTDIRVKATDADNDTVTEDVKLMPPNVIVEPQEEPTPDPDNPDPDIPGNPKDPDPDSPFIPNTKQASIVVDEGALTGIVDENGVWTGKGSQQHDSHGASGDHSFTVELHGEGGKIIVGDKETGNYYEITVDEDGTINFDDYTENKGITIDGVTVTLNERDLVDENGKFTGEVKYHYELNGPQRHDKDGGLVNNDVLYNEDGIGITVTDGTGETATGKLTVEVHDDKPEFGEFTFEPKTDSSVQKSLDFVLKDGEATNKWNDFLAQNKTNGQHWGDDKETPVHGTDYKEHDTSNQAGQDNLHWGVNNGFKIIPTSVTYNADGTVTDLSLQGWGTQDQNTHGIGRAGDLFDDLSKDAYKSGKSLWLTKDGLGVGGENGTGAHEISGNGQDAEAIVLEVNNGSVSYGLDIVFGNMTQGEKVLLSFYLTPRNNGDNDLVKQIEVSFKDLQEGRYQCDLPDGFNKVIISPMRGEDDNYSSFTIQRIDITRPSCEYNGQIEFEGGADGLDDKGLTWQWGIGENTTIMNDDTGTVTVTGTVGAGTYTVKYYVSEDGRTITAVLEGGGGEITLNGNTLFTATLDENGNWSIERFYNFTIDENGSAVYKVTFSMTDTDGDTVTKSYELDLSKGDLKDRFDNVETGYWDKNWSDADKAYDDLAADVLIGGDGGNDLMFGKGGQDILFGDGSEDALTEAVNTFLGENSSYTFEALTGLEKHNAGANEELVKHLYEKLKNSFTEESDGLDDFLEAVEGTGDGGDDALFGGQCDDILFGGAGNDYLNGGPGQVEHNGGRTDSDNDIIFGGSGNDIILYGEGDLIHGGDDVDILLANKGEVSLTDSTSIRNVEVLLEANDIDVRSLGITSSADLEKYGIVMDGEDLYLRNGYWELVPDAGNKYQYTGPNGDGLALNLTVEMEENHFHPAEEAWPPKLQSDDSSQDPKDDTSESDGSVISSSPDSSLKFVADVSSLKDSQDDDPLSVEDDLNGSTGSDTLFADSGNDYLSGSDALSAGDELIQYDPTDYAVFGGDNGIAVLLSNDKNADSLDDLLKAPLGGDKPHVQDVELFLKGDNVEDLTRMSDLQQHGITVDEENKTVTLDEGWKKSGDGSGYVNEDNNWTLETSNVTVQGVDEAAQQAANEIQLTQQG